MSRSPIQKTDERGVALLLTLGVLSLLLILTMSFAFTARTDLLASQVNADIIKARLLCESGLERVLGFLSHSFDNDAGNVPADYCPATSGRLFTDTNAGSGAGSDPAWVGRSYMYSMLGSNEDTAGIESALATNLGDGFDFIPERTNAEITAAEELPNVSWQHVEDDNNDLIGRIAFIVVDESGKLDPTHLVNASEAEGNETRSGLTPDEISLNDVVPSGAGGVDGDDFLSDMHSNAARWFSWRHLHQGVGSMDASEAETCTKTLFPWSFDIEAWDDGGTDKHRFDLPGANWVPMTPANLQAAASDFSAANTGGIPWLARMVDASGNSVADQVAANLIDYCDGDDEPENDFSNSLGSATDMSAGYCGLEELVFINELLFEVVWETDGAGHKLKITPDLEVINMWDGPSTPARLALEVEFSFDGGSGALEWDESLSIGSVSAHSYDDDGALPSENKSFATNGDATLDDFEITAVRAAIGSNAGGRVVAAHLMDFAEIGSSDASSLSEDEPQETTVRVSDPRANHSTPAWEWQNYNSTGTYSLGSANPNADPSAGDDTEPASVTDPVRDISTAYIANADMQNLWELGCIHRGEAWRTINLKGYGSSGNYADGDGGILDQVKIASQTEAYGRVNANSPVQAVWAALLHRIPVGSDYSSPGSSGNSVSPAEALTLSDAVRNHNGALAGSAYNGRGGFCATAELSDGTVVTQNTDAEEEEIIGKVAHLLTVRQNYFSVIVVGQALQDIGSETSNRSISVDLSDGSSTNVNILAEQKIKAVVRRDAFRNSYEVKRYEFLED